VSLYDLINEAVDEEWVNSINWRLVTNKMIYTGHEKKFPVVKVEQELGLSYKNLWKRLQNPVMSRGAVENMYLLLHNKSSTKRKDLLHQGWGYPIQSLILTSVLIALIGPIIALIGFPRSMHTCSQLAACC
jgi:hypothetical protein